MNFTSQICTTKEHSERLLTLGLKKETADMHHYQYIDGGRWNIEAHPSIAGYTSRLVPAWSLHRLIEMLPHSMAFSDGDWNLCIDVDIYGEELAWQVGFIGEFFVKDKELIDALYGMILRLKEEGVI